MSIVTVSSKFQITIPKEVRVKLHIRSGQKLSMIVKGGILYLLPQASLKELEGFVKGIDTSNIRDEEDRY